MYSSALDARGRVVSYTSDSGLAPVEFTYDSEGRISGVDQGPQFWPTRSTRVTGFTRTNAAGHTIEYAYDAADRLTQIVLPSGCDYGYTYDENAAPRAS